MDEVYVNRNETYGGGECIARSDCTYMQSDLALHFPSEMYGPERQDKGQHFYP